ncbi:hypothetical protein [Acuticoccus yangtzensis]|uniref:hypothetical protein n=1 Tax=Acuticoccus yangtzensis TaxID=1443441 RepID=UPI0009494FE9|nr:hypothetical protein [Acuticoccus yangtzensis]ORE93432.1 hypothetical protein ATO13_12181 [Stappia sp. 22II-S9-Z10]
MTKIISTIVILAIIAHMIRPLGLPGLKRRADAWKLVLIAFAVIAITILVRPEPSADLPAGAGPAVALPAPLPAA